MCAGASVQETAELKDALTQVPGVMMRVSGCQEITSRVSHLNTQTYRSRESPHLGRLLPARQPIATR